MNKIKLTPNLGAMVQHLEFLFSQSNEYEDGQIEIAYTGSGNGAPTKAAFFHTNEIQKAADFAHELNSINGVNVYVGAALRIPDCPPFGRSSSDDYYASNVAWVDLDDKGAAESAKDKYKDCPPSLAIVTGRTPHLRTQFWWRLDEGETNYQDLRQTLSNLCGTLNGDRAVVDHARIMRLGGSIAWPKKEGRIPELTEVAVPTGATKKVSLDRLNSCFPIANSTPLLTQMGDREASTNTNVVNFGDGKPREIITGKLRVTELLERTRVSGQWHFNMRDAVAHMVSSHWSDEQIKLSCGPYCDNGGDDKDLLDLIYSARKKWHVPNEERIEISVNDNKDIINAKTGEVIKPDTFDLLYASDITPNTDARDFVEDLLTDEAITVLYGESNCGKTFFTLDLSLHVALGREWRGKEVDQGGVIYAALEGASGTKNRICAFKNHYMIKDDIPLAIIPSNINFIDSTHDMPALIETIRQAEDRIGNVKLIVIDTLARAMGGSDENSGQDMGTLIKNADMIRSITKAHILFVHHSGKDAAKGARGHSSLRAAVDTEIEISRNDKDSPSVVKIVKQREMEMIEDMSFSLEPILLGENKRGKPVKSCVVMPCDPPKDVRNDTRLSDLQQFIYDAILDAMIRFGQLRNIHKGEAPIKSISYDDLKLVLDERGYKEFLDTETKTGSEQMKNHTTNARVALHKKGKIANNAKYIWLLEKGE